MANETILEIGQTLAVPAADASMEGQSASLGSFQIPMSALNYPLASGVFVISSATLTSFNVAYPGAPLRSIPTRIRLTLLMPSSGASMPGLGAVIVDANSFTLVLTGPAGDTTHQVFWEALP